MCETPIARCFKGDDRWTRCLVAMGAQAVGWGCETVVFWRFIDTLGGPAAMVRVGDVVMVSMWISGRCSLAFYCSVLARMLEKREKSCNSHQSSVISLSRSNT